MLEITAQRPHSAAAHSVTAMAAIWGPPATAVTHLVRGVRAVLSCRLAGVRSLGCNGSVVSHFGWIEERRRRHVFDLPAVVLVQPGIGESPRAIAECLLVAVPAGAVPAGDANGRTEGVVRQ